MSQVELCFISDINIKHGSKILIRISKCLPMFEAEGVVVWCNKTSEKYEVGVKFADTGSEFKFRMIEQYKKNVLRKEGRKLSGEKATKEWIGKYAKNSPR